MEDFLEGWVSANPSSICQPGPVVQVSAYSSSSREEIAIGRLALEEVGVREIIVVLVFMFSQVVWCRTFLLLLIARKDP